MSSLCVVYNLDTGAKNNLASLLASQKYPIWPEGDRNAQVKTRLALETQCKSQLYYSLEV